MYKLEITVGHFDDESGDVLNSFNKKYENDKRVSRFYTEIVESEHISGILEFNLVPNMEMTIEQQIENLIKEFSLQGECFDLTDSLGKIILTEESFNIL